MSFVKRRIVYFQDCYSWS